jgi:carbon storage regulator CsrA
MLALSRKVGEVICISGGVKVVVKAIRGSRVLLGFEAPTGTRIMRQEIDHRDHHGALSRHKTRAPAAA